MAIALVGSAGAISSPAAATVTPAYGQSTSVGSLLVACIVSKGASAGAITSASTGWVQAVQNGHTQWAAIWYKPNCASGEATPTFTSASATAMGAVLSEWSGAAISSPVDQTGNSGASVVSANPAVMKTSANDTNASDLCIAVAALNLSVAAVASFAESWTPASGTAGIIGQATASSAFHISATYYLLSGHGGAAVDQNSETETGGTISGYDWAIASFLPAAAAGSKVSAPIRVGQAVNRAATFCREFDRSDRLWLPRRRIFVPA